MDPTASTTAKLQQAAMLLFDERGYDGTTVADIAARAGVTERTFFRHFADKREVLFSHSAGIDALVLGAIASTPAGASGLDAIARVFDVLGPYFDEHRDDLRRRWRIISSSVELQERSLNKMAQSCQMLADVIAQRGVPEETANLIGEIGISVFQRGHAEWEHDEERSLTLILQRYVAALRAFCNEATTPRFA